MNNEEIIRLIKEKDKRFKSRNRRIKKENCL